MNEFELIRRYFQRPARRAAVRLGIGDDGALLQPDGAQELVICSDTLIAGRHFPAETPSGAIGYKALAVNLSDLAAMGAEPLAFLLNLSLPEADETFLEGFAAGLFELADRYDVDLIGGDTTRGELAITVTALGQVPAGQALRRDGARAGDVLGVVGTLGGAAQALALGDAAPAALRARLDRPEPQVAAGLALRGLATSAIDVSDGLAADLGQVLTASNCGATVDARRLPVDPLLADLPAARQLELALRGGDDYALCVSVPADRLAAVREALGERWQEMGAIEPAPGLRLRGADGKVEPLATGGYRHF